MESRRSEESRSSEERLCVKSKISEGKWKKDIKRSEERM